MKSSSYAPLFIIRSAVRYYEPFVLANRSYERKLAQNFAAEGKQRQMAGALDSASQSALVLGAGAGLAARADLAVVGDEPPQSIGLLVIDGCVLVSAELTFTRPGEETPSTALAFIRKTLVAHVLTPIEWSKRKALERELILFFVFCFFKVRSIVGTLAMRAFAPLIEHDHFIRNDFRR